MRGFELPEIRRVDLCGTVLALHAWGKSDVRGFGWYEAPGGDRSLRPSGCWRCWGRWRRSDYDNRAEADGIPSPSEVGSTFLWRRRKKGFCRRGGMAAADGKDIATIDYDTDPRQRGPVTQGPSDLLIRVEMLEHGGGPASRGHLRVRGSIRSRPDRRRGSRRNFSELERARQKGAGEGGSGGAV